MPQAPRSRRGRGRLASGAEVTFSTAPAGSGRFPGFLQRRREARGSQRRERWLRLWDGSAERGPRWGRWSGGVRGRGGGRPPCPGLPSSVLRFTLWINPSSAPMVSPRGKGGCSHSFRLKGVYPRLEEVVIDLLGAEAGGGVGAWSRVETLLSQPLGPPGLRGIPPRSPPGLIPKDRLDSGFSWPPEKPWRERGDTEVWTLGNGVRAGLRWPSDSPKPGGEASIMKVTSYSRSKIGLVRADQCDPQVLCSGTQAPSTASEPLPGRQRWLKAGGFGQGPK